MLRLRLILIWWSRHKRVFNRRRRTLCTRAHKQKAEDSRPKQPAIQRETQTHVKAFTTFRRSRRCKLMASLPRHVSVGDTRTDETVFISPTIPSYDRPLSAETSPWLDSPHDEAFRHVCTVLRGCWQRFNNIPIAPPMVQPQAKPGH